MERIHRIRAESMTEVSFQPFGELLDATEPSPGHSGSFPVRFVGGMVPVSTALLPYKGLKFTGLEQHFHVTQAFIPISGAPAVVAVAAPTPQGDANLFGAFLIGVKLFAANLSGADLTGSTSLSMESQSIEQLSTASSLYDVKGLDNAIMEQIKEHYPHLLEDPNPS